MKKIIFVILFTTALVQNGFSQNLDQLMTDYEQIENAKKEVVDFKIVMEEIRNADPTGELASSMPGFMNNIDSMVVVTLNDCSEDIKDKLDSDLTSFKDNELYETLINVKEKEEKVRIIKKKGESPETELFILGIDDEDSVIVKMYGTFNESDITDLINEQKKNINRNLDN